MPAPRVSIAMTTYDGGPYVGDQLASFARQSVLPDELVVCDDASGDDTLERLERFAESAPFAVRVERNPTNLTSTPNFEKAVSLCRGEIIFLADQDDVWLPHKIETLVGRLDAAPDVGAIFSNGRVVDEGLTPLGYRLWDSLWFSESERERVRRGRACEVFVKHVVAAGTTMAFRSRYRDLYLPFPVLRDSHDPWIACVIAGVAGISIEEQDLIDYRLHGANQIGLEKLSLSQQLAKAREQLSIGAFRHNVEFFSALQDRLRLARERGYAVDPRMLALVEGKITHAGLRDGMSARLLQRLPAILRETFNGGYFRFSYGWKSVAQDLLLR